MHSGYSILRGKQYTYDFDDGIAKVLIHSPFKDRFINAIGTFVFDEDSKSVFGTRYTFLDMNRRSIKKLFKMMIEAGVPYDASYRFNRAGPELISFVRFTEEGKAETHFEVSMPGISIPSMANQEEYSNRYLTTRLISA